MQKALTRLLLLACVVLGAPAQAAPAEAGIRVASYNLRYQNPDDGANAWPLRKDAVRALIRFHGFDIVGTQEGLAPQIADLAQMDEYAYSGVGRDDGRSAGEHSAIFYRKQRFTLLAHGDFWFSQTPDVPSKGWDAQCCKRIASWVQLQDQHSGQSLYVLSVHFDHEGVVARRESAKLLLRKIKTIAGDSPVVCLGDFNSTPETEQILTIQAALRDARAHSATPPYGPVATFNGFQWNTAPQDRIDYIFVNGPVQVHTYATLSDSQDQRYPSDHFPVMADIVLGR